MYENMQVITLDIAHFYDSIDFLGIYRLFDNCLNTQEKNILKELVSYNEKIMRKIMVVGREFLRDQHMQGL